MKNLIVPSLMLMSLLVVGCADQASSNANNTVPESAATQHPTESTSPQTPIQSKN